MVKKIVMPKLGTTMRSGVIAQWYKKIGEYIENGERLLSIENNKAEVEVESPSAGYLVHVFGEAGDEFDCGLTIGLVADGMDEDISYYMEHPNVEFNPADVTNTKTGIQGEAVETQAIPSPKKQQEGRQRIIPKARTLAKRLGIDPAAVAGTGPNGVITPRDIEKAAALSQTSPKASPLAKAVATQLGVNLTEVSGTGDRGKIMRDDVLAAVSSAGPVSPVTGDRRVPFNGMRRTIANNMMGSLKSMAQLCHRLSIDMTNAHKLRDTFSEEGVKISYNDILIKAVTKALMEYPMVNASIDGDEVVLHGTINIGIAVALDEGLIVPNIKGTQNMSLSEIASCSRSCIEKAKSGTITNRDYTGGTFTISNLGMYDLEDFVAIINPPEAAILAVGKIQDRPVVENGEIVVRPMMTVCLSYDHRILDGAPAAAFLKRIKRLIEMPCLLL